MTDHDEKLKQQAHDDLMRVEYALRELLRPLFHPIMLIIYMSLLVFIVILLGEAGG